MAFDAVKARLVQELADAQATLRDEYGLAARPEPSSDKDSLEDSRKGSRSAKSTD